MLISRCIAAVASVLLAGGTGAQGPASLAPSDRIRFSLPDRPAIVAEVLVQRGESLWVRLVRSADTVSLTLSELARLDISRGLKRHPVRGAVIGGISGAVVGGAIGYFFLGDCSAPRPYPGVYISCTSASQAALIGGADLGAVGAAVGAVVGSLIRTERWEPLVERRGQVALWHSGRGRAYGIGFRYKLS